MVPLQLLVASALAWTGEPNGVVYEFTAENWCKPCQAMSPIVSKLQRQGYPIEKIDIDRDKQTPARYGVDRYPTFVLVIDGREVDRQSGMMSEESLKTLCARIPRKQTEHTPQKMKSTESKAALVDLGQAGQLPKATAAQPPAEKPGALARFFGGRNQHVPTSAPAEMRGQGEDSAATDDRQPATPLAATVRLRVKDAGGDNVGTGTIVESRPGQTLILTCGHIFRQWAKGSQVYVDLFRGEHTTEIVGKLVAYELDDRKGLDIGLVSISTDQPLPACRVAPSGTGILAGATVTSVGCSVGERPTVQQQKITAINRYKTNDIECSAIPEPGRSGGGLFNRSGRVIGICMCADPKYREGLYAGLKAIHTFLDRQGLSRVHRDELSVDEEPRLVANTENDVETTMSDAPSAGLGEPAREHVRRSAEQSAALAVSEADRDSSMNFPVSREDVVGSEVVIIIRGNGKSGAPSKVVRLHRASRGFWENLVPELEPRESFQETTLKSSGREPAKRPARRQARRPETTDLQASSRISAIFEAATDEPQPYRRHRSAKCDKLAGARR